MVSVAVIGAGYWGKNIIRVMYELHCLVAVCDTNLQAIEDACQHMNDVHRVQNFDDVINNSAIDAVMIATPSSQHFALASKAIRAGKDVFVEKPMTLNIVEGKQLVDLAVQYNCILMVGHILQYHPAIQTLRSLMQNGEIGDLQYIHAQRLNFGIFRKQENSLWSFAPHDFSLALSLTDCMPNSVVCSGDTDTTLTHMEFSNGVHGYFYVSWLYPKKDQRFVVVGSKKMAVFDDCSEHKLTLYPYSKDHSFAHKEAEFVDVEDVEPLLAECSHFLECIMHRRQPRTDGSEGVRVLTVLDACQQSLASNTPVTLTSH